MVQKLRLGLVLMGHAFFVAQTVVVCDGAHDLIGLSLIKVGTHAKPTVDRRWLVTSV